MLALKRGNFSPMGVDVGETQLRAAQLFRSGNEWSVTATAQAERNPQEPVPSALARACASAGFRKRNYVTALNPPDVEFHVLELPQATLAAGQQELIHWEIGRLCSATADTMETRHWMLPPRPGSATATVIGVSAARTTVLNLIGNSRAGGLTCICLDTGATAVHRFGSLLRAWPHDVVWGVLDLGARQARLTLSLGHVPVLIRHTGLGGQAWTERVAESLGISQDAAEIQKTTHGVASVASREARGPAPGHSPDEVALLVLGALRAELNEMAAEIKKSYEYVLGSYPGRTAGDLMLVGGGANMPNLALFFSGLLGIPVRRCSEYLSEPTCRLRTQSLSGGRLEQFATAVGLAVEEAIQS